ncbi:DUF2922 domain-containing protein [Enterococcus sp. 669A]|uniref:DUF2922 domain-containing protein n=1 Tax=Candidatus Enterococcus moelleringii TaxID=2815325 RepID=A0ABS3LG71_9ENTE|nr:DUF2922 domain-containing protein [Enterococcus sp. 669A]
MIKLVSQFLNSVGKRHTFSVKDPNTDLSPAEVRESLDLLASLDIFEKDGVKLFQKPINAKYVETIETPVFNGDEYFSDANQPVRLNQEVLHGAAVKPEVDEPIEEQPAEEVDESLKLAELQAQSSYRALPAAPQVSLNQPEESIKATPETPKALEEKPRTPGTQPETDSHSYNLIMDMLRRRTQRKAEERQKKNLN